MSTRIRVRQPYRFDIEVLLAGKWFLAASIRVTPYGAMFWQDEITSGSAAPGYWRYI